jgi:hypothetical protein
VKQDSGFARARVFADTLGELRNLSTEYDRIPRAWSDLRELGFSKWIPLAKYDVLNTGWLPGVYVIAAASSQPVRMSIVDERAVYIGETVDQSLRKRLYQLNRSLIEGKPGHSGGATLRAQEAVAFHQELSIGVRDRRCLCRILPGLRRSGTSKGRCYTNTFTPSGPIGPGIPNRTLSASPLLALAAVELASAICRNP